MKGIYKSGNVYWIRYAGLDGLIVRESTGSDKYRKAEALLLERKQGIKEGRMPEIKVIKNHSFKDLAEEYKKWAEKQRAYKSKKSFINHLEDTFGLMPLRRFSTLMVEQFQSGELGKEKKPATINRFLATLKHMFTKAVEWDMVEEQTLKRIRKVKLLPENNRRLRYLSKDQLEHLLIN